MSKRMVNCRKFGKQLPGLEQPPFPGEMGDQIYEHISEEAWRLWSEDMQMKVLNEYRLNMGDPKDYQTLVEQMMIFLNLQSGDVSEVENETRGRSGDE